MRGRRESERERALLRAEEEEEKEDGKGMTMVKGRGTEVGVGGEPSKEGAKRGGTGERERNGSRRSRRRVGWNRGWQGCARGSQKGGEERREREVRHARPGVEGRSSPGQGYPPPRGSHPLAARQRAIYHWLRTTLLTHVPVLSSLYPSPTSPNPLLYLPCAAIATAAASTIDPYSLLLRGTFARIASGLAPRKSSKGTRVRVFL